MNSSSEVTRAGGRPLFAPAEEVIETAKAGGMFILVDHEDRENEGDLVIPAETADAGAINFMARHGRGLICLAIEAERADALELQPMAVRNSSRFETAFMVSIEAREGVSTGISAADRARTIAVAIDPRTQPADIATPGHVFPLRAQAGGVLVRAGHTEAAVDVARLAGRRPAGVICEIMNPDGSMARLPDLAGFADRHALPIGTITDLIAYRRRHDNLVRELVRDKITSFIGGEWCLRVFQDAPGGAEHIALSRGDVSDGNPVLTRMHVIDPLEDLLALNPTRWNQVADSMVEITREGRGAIVLLRDAAPNVISAKFQAAETGRKIQRRYGIGAQILCSLGMRDIILLTNSPSPDLLGLDGYDLNLVGTRPIPRVSLD
ncbi:3,4-dihydroxy-2-butanone-4-phosphate synthase [Roseovarius salis]|uniref:3,4-dihydroxy-2-butanone-4-phosphate synthase n=1 Tax=Roseovarius salis TaxID=3376063 RepID=UPI0037C78AEA